MIKDYFVTTKNSEEMANKICQLHPDDLIIKFDENQDAAAVCVWEQDRFGCRWSATGHITHDFNRDVYKAAVTLASQRQHKESWRECNAVWRIECYYHAERREFVTGVSKLGRVSQRKKG